MHGDAIYMLDRLCDNFTARELLGMLSDSELATLYNKAADLMEWGERP